MKHQLEQALNNYYGEDFRPNSSMEAGAMWRNLGDDVESLPPKVYLALQILKDKNMGKKDNPKKKDRKHGQKLRKKRTGSRRG